MVRNSMESIMYRDPELEASFSFSCYDFNSSPAVFSDDDINGNKDDEYIEIVLEQPTNADVYVEVDPESSSAQELEFRISVSSIVPLLQVSNAGLARANTGESIGSEFETVTTPSSVSSSSTSTLSCSSAETCWATETSKVPAAAISRKTVKPRVQFRAVNRLLTTFLSTDPKPSSSIMKKDGHDESRQVMAIHTDGQRELVRSRSATKIRKATNSGIIMKFSIKCRSINVRTMLASFLKPYQIMNSLHGSDNSSGQNKKMMMVRRCRDQMKPFEKWLMQREIIRDHEQANATTAERSRSVFDITLDSFRGALHTMSTSLGCKDKRRKNYSSTNISTHNHHYHVLCPTETNSIQAAIAHCKRSLGHSSESRF